jgi:uncharacterized protein YciI
MQFLIAGILKADVEEQVLALHNDFNEHLAQPYRKIALAGALRGKDGKRTGYVAVIEAEDFAQAQAWLDQSPFYANDLYDRVEVAEFAAEVGYLE